MAWADRVRTIEINALMDERQKRILDALQNERSELANFYEIALNLLNGIYNGLDTRSRVSFISHCMREVMNRVLGLFGRPTPGKFKPSSREQIKKLPDLLVRFPDFDLDQQSDSVLVPKEIASVMDTLFKAAVRERKRIRDDVAALITDDDNAEHVAVSRWIQSRDFFVKWAHLHDRDVGESDIPTDDEIRKHFAVFDELLDGVITAFFSARDSIDALLAEVNALEE